MPLTPPHSPSLYSIAIPAQGSWKHAEQKYAKALRVLLAAGHEADTVELAETVSGQKVAVMLNLAAIGAKTQEHGQAITWCTKAIKCDVLCERGDGFQCV